MNLLSKPSNLIVVAFPVREAHPYRKLLDDAKKRFVYGELDSLILALKTPPGCWLSAS
jgi:hypothetical protein